MIPTIIKVNLARTLISLSFFTVFQFCKLANSDASLCLFVIMFQRAKIVQQVIQTHPSEPRSQRVRKAKRSYETLPKNVWKKKKKRELAQRAPSAGADGLVHNVA
jgi:hypothetical protein